MHSSETNEPTVQELLSLRHRVAVVTGATGYLGRRMAHALAEAGASVVATSRSEPKAAQLIADLPCDDDQQHVAVAMDLAREASLIEGLELAANTCGQIDILVNNAHAPSAQDWTSVTHEQFTQQLANASGYFVLSRYVRDHAVARGASASIIMLGSMYGLVGSYPEAYADICPASPVAYHALKGGIAQMTRHLAVYWAADGVRVNCLCPGPFPDPDRAPQTLIERLKQHVPMQRMGMPSELKGVVVFLASPASSYVTGQVLVVDGGWTAW
jgi:gluconate 5-dehydrogenase